MPPAPLEEYTAENRTNLWRDGWLTSLRDPLQQVNLTDKKDSLSQATFSKPVSAGYVEHLRVTEGRSLHKAGSDVCHRTGHLGLRPHAQNWSRRRARRRVDTRHEKLEKLTNGN